MINIKSEEAREHRATTDDVDYSEISPIPTEFVLHTRLDQPSAQHGENSIENYTL